MDKNISAYHDLELAARIVGEGRHRDFVGGLWDEVGKLQFDFMRRQGLTPDMVLLDVGCGCLRGGVHFVRYLSSGHYYGIDISRELLDAGYDEELGKLHLQHKLPRENLACNEDFSAEQFGVTFDLGMAQSLFTHLPLNHIRLCLARLSPVFRPDGVFYATIFLCPEEHDWSTPLLHTVGGITSYPEKNPFHYCAQDLVHCTRGLPWRFDLIGDWNHPRDQMMVAFTRT